MLLPDAPFAACPVSSCSQLIENPWPTAVAEMLQHRMAIINLVRASFECSRSGSLFVCTVAL